MGNSQSPAERLHSGASSGDISCLESARKEFVVRARKQSSGSITEAEIQVAFR
eukprot:CAMPEP_0172629414 /NCGR_PEP_ID=MMETSP1068-20121228/167637_1 /TAXON_ID=35684 /ORGANISM="Pseudopedinella elastica, Strain CCMP716" /LENGTH=52 /DNA_ID=CAMNT_0013439937 /DNA_START=84 /DNA_END=239 /DNA_ORIENTATION=-